jgi:hypothetical protein
MKYAVIAALLIANTSAVVTDELAECSTESECGPTNRCASVTRKNANGAY